MSKSKTTNSTPSPQGVFSSRREALRAAAQANSKEIPDQTPVAIPVGMDKPLTLREEMMRFIRTEISQQAEKEGQESFEEFDDFNIPDEDPDLTSPYTVQMDDEPGSYLLEPTPEDKANTVPESDTPPAERSEATGAEGPDNSEPREDLTNNAIQR